MNNHFIINILRGVLSSIQSARNNLFLVQILNYRHGNRQAGLNRFTNRRGGGAEVKWLYCGESGPRDRAPIGIKFHLSPRLIENSGRHLPGGDAAEKTAAPIMLRFPIPPPASRLTLFIIATYTARCFREENFTNTQTPNQNRGFNAIENRWQLLSVNR
jgi:hypothetical protein